jgi:asparagine synthase (glutamine-hydrolysing)
MCGINGILQLKPNGQPLLQDQIVAMNAAISHRGPDGDGSFVHGTIALGHRRLAILDLTEAGAQPMHSADGALTLVFNGEIYNYVELAQELQAKGYVFKSHSDTEVILYAYREWGEDCVQRFNGMWAFALWDEPQQKLFASRDRLGVKPFFYLRTDEQFIFSSEIAGIRAVKPVREANLGKLHDYLAYGYRTNNGETFFKDILELKPGHSMISQAGQISFKRFWEIKADPLAAAPSAGTAASERGAAYVDLLRDAVRLRFRSDVPVALLQSGGIDSSVICTIVNDEIESQRLGVETVTAFTATHPGHASDESAPVRELMKTCPHIKSVELSPDGDTLASDCSDYVRAMQEPMGSAASYAHWHLMKEVRRQGIKVMINGQGADEALAGYGQYIRGYRLLDLLQTRPAAALTEARAIRREMPWGYKSLVFQTFKALVGRRTASRLRARYIERSFSVLTDDFKRAQRDYLPDLAMAWDGKNLHRHLRSQLQDYGLNQILNYEDQSAMSQGIEIRSPFVDYRLMEFAFALPDEAKFSGGITKKILRQGFSQRVPDSIINSKIKLGFSIPFADWMQRPTLQALVRKLVDSPSFKSRKIWDADKLAAILTDPKAIASGFPVWRFLMVALWLNEYGISNV